MDSWRVSEGYPDHGIIDQHGHLIAMVTTYEDRPQEPEEILRNAVLIAAAPELLDALKSLFADWVTLVGEDLKEQSDDVALLWKCCEDAIAKAEGRGGA